MANQVLPAPTDKLKARFWSKVDKRGPDDCWEWTAYRCRLGYGRLGSFVATQISLLLDGRPRPEGVAGNALHSCDNPPCVNPAHLRWGTPKDNMDDLLSRHSRAFSDLRKRAGKKNTRRGSKHPCAKITEKDVRSIRADTRPHEDIARDFGIAKSRVSSIKLRTTWRHVV